MNRIAPEKQKSAAVSRIMTKAAKTEFGHDDIAHLAYLNWQRDGCPPGRALDYWLEAESQLRATWHLLLAAGAAADAAEAIEEIRLRELAVVFSDGSSDETDTKPRKFEAALLAETI